jgi:hypothetical protein
MKSFFEPFIVTIYGLLMLLHILRILRIITGERILKHKAFAFPEDGYMKVFYCLCAMLVFLVLIMVKVGRIGLGGG